MIRSIGLNIFSARVLNDPRITSRVQTAINDWLASERESGYPSSWNVLRTITDKPFSIFNNNDQGQGLITRFIALVDQLNHYHEHFVQPYLEWIARYYSQQLTGLGDPSSHSPTEIMNTCLRYLEEERIRAVAILHPESIIPVEQTILSHFVAPMQEWLAEAGMRCSSAIHSGFTHYCDYQESRRHQTTDHLMSSTSFTFSSQRLPHLLQLTLQPTPQQGLHWKSSVML
jgi:hypothetical protein